MKKKSGYLLFFILASFSTYSYATISISNPTTDEVHLKSDCSNTQNCATTLVELLNWIWNTRQPSAASPLLVNIGVGKFYTRDGGFFNDGSFCKNSGNVTFRGAGRGNSVITSNSTFSGVSIVNCRNLAFQDITLDGGDTIYPFYWTGYGNSTYSNIEMIGEYGAWYDDGCALNETGVFERSKHFFHGSKIHGVSSDAANLVSAYITRCAETWFYGSEISIAVNNSNTTQAFGILAESGEVHVYGSVIRAVSEPGITLPEVVAVSSSGGNVHIHGTGIDTISVEPNNITALSVSNGGSIHANESSFVLKTGDGAVSTRLKNNGGTIQAPYLWQEGSTPPAIISTHGSDMTITTDTADGQPHIAVFSDNCPSKWFDTVTNACRAQ